MPWMKAQDIASALHGFSSQERMRDHRRNGSWRWQDSSKVILKRHGMLVDLVLLTTDAAVSRTEIAVWIVLWEV